MPLFGRKKEDERMQEPVTEIKEEEKQVEEIIPPERPAAVPVFVKLERYKEIINSMNEVKVRLNTIKNAVSVLREIENLREECSKLIRNAIDKIDGKMTSLDAEFLRPIGYVEEVPKVSREAESLDNILSDLKSKVDQLRSEIQAVA